MRSAKRVRSRSVRERSIRVKGPLEWMGQSARGGALHGVCPGDATPADMHPSVQQWVDMSQAEQDGAFADLLYQAQAQVNVIDQPAHPPGWTIGGHPICDCPRGCLRYVFNPARTGTVCNICFGTRSQLLLLFLR